MFSSASHEPMPSFVTVSLVNGVGRGGISPLMSDRSRGIWERHRKALARSSSGSFSPSISSDEVVVTPISMRVSQGWGSTYRRAISVSRGRITTMGSRGDRRPSRLMPFSRGDHRSSRLSVAIVWRSRRGWEMSGVTTMNHIPAARLDGGRVSSARRVSTTSRWQTHRM